MIIISYIKIPVESARGELISYKEVYKAAIGETIYTYEPLETIVELILKV